MIATQTILCPICRASNPARARFCQQCGKDVLLDNIYRITKVIKEGGMGTVYKAIDEAGIDYAVKEMHDRFASAAEREDGIERFVEEADLLRKLRHPAVPRVYRSFIDEGRYYLAMEFIRGEDLEDRLKREHSIPEPIVLQWAAQICDVLDYMHDQGLIYRDMKPANVMITNEGDVKLIDFGIAKLLQPGQRNTTIGTPGYAPPEQYQGLASSKSDIYALEASLHHMLTGRDPRDHPPFSFPLASEVNPAISAQTTAALDKALSMDETSRFQTVEAFRRALPIPTGDRRPTLPFDMPRTGSTTRIDPEPLPTRPMQPAQPPVKPARPQPAQPPAKPAQPPAKPARPRAQQPAPRRRGGFGRAVGRLVSTTALITGLTYAGAIFAPNTVMPVLEQVIPAQILQQVPGLPAIGSTGQNVPDPSPPTTNNPNTNAPQVLISPELTLDITVGTIDGNPPSISVLRNEFLNQARLQYSNAELINGRMPTSLGSAQPVGDPVNGIQNYTATLRGQVSYSQQP